MEMRFCMEKNFKGWILFTSSSRFKQRCYLPREDLRPKLDWRSLKYAFLIIYNLTKRNSQRAILNLIQSLDILVLWLRRIIVISNIVKKRKTDEWEPKAQQIFSSKRTRPDLNSTHLTRFKLWVYVCMEHRSQGYKGAGGKGEDPFRPGSKRSSILVIEFSESLRS